MFSMFRVTQTIHPERMIDQYKYWAAELPFMGWARVTEETEEVPCPFIGELSSISQIRDFNTIKWKHEVRI